MTQQNLSRRNFMAVVSGVPVASLTTPTSLSWLLENQLGCDRVYTHLQRHLALQPRDKAVVRSFYQSLLTLDEHGQSATQLRALLLDSSRSDDLERYLLEEFITTTNYLAVQEDKEAQLLFVGIPS